MSPPRPVIIGAVAVVAVAGIGWWLFADRDSGDTLVLYGNVDVREVALAFRQPGRLQMVNVDEGHTVQAGDVVAELDAGPYQDALAAAEAQAAGARAELERLERGSRPQEIRQAEEAVRRSRAVFARADADFERQQGLSASGGASRKTLEAARASRDEAAAALAAAEESLSLAREGARTEDIAAGRARLAAAEAQLAQARTALADTRLVAPADATVQSRVLEPGSMVTSRDAVFTLSLRHPVYVRAYVAEPELGRVRPGARVIVTTDSSDVEYDGHVGFVSPRAEFTPRAVETSDLRTDLVYRVRIVVDDSDDGLRQGMPVTVTVATGNAAGADAATNQKGD
jgi:HlyD family secretion protein